MYSLSPNPSVIRISGSDRLDFLHRLTSQSFKTRKADDFFYGACLLANGGVIGLFGAWVRADDVLLIPLGKSAEPILKFLDHYHFGEDVRFEGSADFQVVHLFGEGSGALGASDSSMRFPGPLKSVLGNESMESEILLIPSNQSISFPSVRELSSTECATFYAGNGLPEAGVDLTAENILIEAPLDNFVHRTKGCYPGQEVIERIYTYGNVAKYVLVFKPGSTQESALYSDADFTKRSGTSLLVNETKVGTIRSVRKALDGSIFSVAQIQRIPAEKHTEFIDETGLNWILVEESLERVQQRQKAK